ncbi:DEAD/DEAH box helicase family protein, partial [Candidatus Woesearchaeota archaeon]|nr:DEAD/DEAH box helicase family protein [Candidatus Woesearchaeota archaeon]
MEFYFPFDEPRKVQKAFLVQVASAVSQRQSLLVHAPTGLGKTAAALCGILDFALKNKKTVFFLTSRHTQHQIAIETLRMIKNKHKIPLHVVDIIGKQHMCLQPGVDEMSSSEFTDYCKDLREKGTCNYYSRLKAKQAISVEAQLALQRLDDKGPVHVEELHSICRDLEVCSYEIAGMFGKKATVIVADYYHILHPSVRESLFKRIQKNLAEC